MTRRCVAVAGVLASRVALACPACASGQRGGPNALHLLLVFLPFAIAAFAARAIYRAMRD